MMRTAAWSKLIFSPLFFRHSAILVFNKAEVGFTMQFTSENFFAFVILKLEFRPEPHILLFRRPKDYGQPQQAQVAH